MCRIVSIKSIEGIEILDGFGSKEPEGQRVGCLALRGLLLAGNCLYCLFKAEVVVDAIRGLQAVTSNYLFR